MKGLFIVANGLRVVDVALCCPDASGRQGNIAYMLLKAVYFIANGKFGFSSVSFVVTICGF